MSQSKPSYEPDRPKSTARVQRHRHRADVAQGAAERESNTESHPIPEPACRSRATGRSIDAREWREVRFDTRRLGTITACEYCFPAGPPDATELETVVRSCSHPTVYHRPHSHDRSVSFGSGDETTTGAGESAVDSFAAITFDDDAETIRDVTELRKGDGVLWQGQATPLVVVGAAASPTGTANLRGPSGGDYRVEGRPDCAQAYYIRPGYACQSDLIRVPAPTRHEAV
jgi:hypothetical protein